MCLQASGKPVALLNDFHTVPKRILLHGVAPVCALVLGVGNVQNHRNPFRGGDRKRPEGHSLSLLRWVRRDVSYPITSALMRRRRALSEPGTFCHLNPSDAVMCLHSGVLRATLDRCRPGCTSEMGYSAVVADPSDQPQLIACAGCITVSFSGLRHWVIFC